MQKRGTGYLLSLNLKTWPKINGGTKSMFVQLVSIMICAYTFKSFWIFKLPCFVFSD